MRHPKARHCWYLTHQCDWLPGMTFSWKYGEVHWFKPASASSVEAPSPHTPQDPCPLTRHSHTPLPWRSECSSPFLFPLHLPCTFVNYQRQAVFSPVKHQAPSSKWRRLLDRCRWINWYILIMDSKHEETSKNINDGESVIMLMAGREEVFWNPLLMLPSLLSQSNTHKRAYIHTFQC